ncbi:hypothetical protein HVPorG_05037 (plasmid) [Roseomonas mucosa]|uniref:hypothetical protein n=1 Tax=Roseomonas mucosa TaxID=207340 RepID=UPI00220ECC09|nr:hypothetical protein [Roseomonas mucosa]QDJ12111.1 hypothetical protein HVPorG_05037 [Roseomonas mucosa]
MTQPSIGIFWGIVGAGQQPALLVDLVPLAGGETYGEFLTHGGHYEYWTKLARMGASGLRRLGLPGAPLWSEYEEWLSIGTELGPQIGAQKGPLL